MTMEDAPEQSRANRPEHSGKGHCSRKRWIVSAVVVAVLAVGIVLLLLLLPDDKISGTWRPIAPGGDAVQVLLVKNGKRMVVVPRWRDNNVEDSQLLKVYDQNLTHDPTDPDSESWYLHSEIPFEGRLSDSDKSQTVAVSEDGQYMAVWSSFNVTILRDVTTTTETETGAWEQVGEVVTPSDVLGESYLDVLEEKYEELNANRNSNVIRTVNMTGVGFRARNAMAFSEDGNILTMWLAPAIALHYGVLVSFQQDETNGTFLLKSRQHDLVTTNEYDRHDQQYIAGSGNGVALASYTDNGEMIKVYENNQDTTTNISNETWSAVATIIGPPQDHDSDFGGVGDISYDGSVLATSAQNYKQTGRFRSGTVQVYEKKHLDNNIELASYHQPKGQAIEPEEGCVLGKHVVLNPKDASRMAIHANCRHDNVQVYQYQNNRWKKLGDPILNSMPSNRVKHLSMSWDGSRIAIAWDNGSMVYELQ